MGFSTSTFIIGVVVMLGAYCTALPAGFVSDEITGFPQTTSDTKFVDERTTPDDNLTELNESDVAIKVAHGRHKRNLNSETYGNLYQQIQTPRIGCPIQLVSSFPKPGYLSVYATSTANQYISLTTTRTSRKTLFYRGAEPNRFNTSNEFTLMTYAGMGDHVNTPYQTPAFNAIAQRLVRHYGRLAAMSKNIYNSARLVLKRWPPICGDDSSKIYDPPTFVQIMLVLDENENYNGALLNVDVKTNGFEKLTFITKQDSLYPDSECVPVGEQHFGKSNPSVLPSTLFQVAYLPCED